MRDAALAGIVEACPGLPRAVKLGYEHAPLPPQGELFSARAQTCTNYDAFRFVRMRHARLDGDLRDAGEEYVVCELDRFELTDRVTYAVTDDVLQSFMLYDFAVRQGAEPEVTRPLVQEVFVHAPIDLTVESLGRLPHDPAYARGDDEGLGVRLTRSDVLAPGFAPVPVSALDELRPALRQQRDRWMELPTEPFVALGQEFQADRKPPAFLIAADADVDARTLVAVVELGRDEGFDHVSALYTGWAPRLNSVSVSRSEEAWDLIGHSDEREVDLCVGVDGAWAAGRKVWRPVGLRPGPTAGPAARSTWSRSYPSQTFSPS